MIEVKGRASMIWYWAGVGAFLSLLGWLAFDWVEDLGKLWEILSVSLMVTGVIIAGIGVWKAFDKRPVLVVDAEGILDRTSMPTRHIAWNDIRGFSLVPQGRKPLFLAVELADPAQFLSKATYGTSALLEAMDKNYGTPCVVSLRALDAEPNALLIRLKSELSMQRR